MDPGNCRRVTLERVEILRCPDEKTATRVLAAAGVGKLERLGRRRMPRR